MFLPLFILLICLHYVDATAFVTSADITVCTVSDVDEFERFCEDVSVYLFVVEYGGLIRIQVLPINAETTGLAESFFVDQEPVKVTITQDKPGYEYPLTAFGLSVVFETFEETIKEDNRALIEPFPPHIIPQCVDSFGPPSQCGGDPGFCCVKDLLHYAIALSGQTIWYRGEIALGYVTGSLAPPNVFPFFFSTVHCLRYGTLTESKAEALQYQAFEIGDPRTNKTIFFELQQGEEIATFELSPGDPIHNTEADPTYTGNLGILAQIIGAYTGTAEPENFANELLLIPVGPPGHPVVIASENGDRSHDIIIPRELFRNGPNTVGADKVEFEGQKGFCSASSPGDGIHNTLKDLLEQGIFPYNVTERFGDRLVLDRGVGRFSLFLEDRGIVSTLVRLQTKGAIIINEFISQAVLEASILGFAAGAESGTLKVRVTNVGDETENFLITVDCDTFTVLSAVLPQQETLIPDDFRDLTFSIDAESSLAVNHSCNVSVSNTINQVTDSVRVFFDTTTYVSRTGSALLALNRRSIVTVPGDTCNCEFGCLGVCLMGSLGILIITSTVILSALSIPGCIIFVCGSLISQLNIFGMMDG